jgi:peptide/nickel transport system permease protein
MSTDKLQMAQDALVGGERMRARKLVREALLQNPQDERAWLLMARVVDQAEQVIDCLDRANKINPENVATSRALRAFRRQVRNQGEYHASPVTHSTSQSPIRYVASTQVKAVPRIQAGVITLPGHLVEIKRGHVGDPNGDKKIISPRRAANLSLIIGSLLVLLVVAIAVIGPRLAPADPLEEHAVVKVGEGWETPPFPAFTVPGFPLGSDQFGRDLLSRILWGVRPTLSMVAVVAVVRLVIGTLIGLGAGWFNGRLGRWLDTLISAALAVPVLMIALGAIAMLGAEIGLLAFIIGLSINGWGETARFVRDQTQTIKNQLYIEAAHALGASTFSILSRHILRQIMPMLWMLFAFEISNTLMATAGLGFLGYFIGGDVWIEVSDFVSRRVSGMPELGQMLATAWVNLIEPWPLVITGTVVFVAVLGFNLMGEGLRSRHNPEYVNRNNLVFRFGQWFGSWMEEQVTYPFGTWLRRSLLHPMMVSMAVLGLAGIIFSMQALLTGGVSQTALTIPGGQYWAAERGDPYGSRSSAAVGPSEPQVLWSIQSNQVFSGNPVVASDGTIYLSFVENKLMALDPDGATLWEASLPDSLVGTPAIGPDGTVFVAGTGGELFAISNNGVILWTYQADAFGQVKHGPVVSRVGKIYFLMDDGRGDTLFALSPDGQLIWSTPTSTRAANTVPRLSPDEQFIFIKNVMLNVEDGSLIDLTLPSSEDMVLAGREQFVVGGDGLLYLHVGHYMFQWTQGSAGFEIVQAVQWNYRGAGFSQSSTFPRDSGVTRNGNIWLFYSAYYGGTSIVWLDPTGKVLGTSLISLLSNTMLVAVDGGNTAYLCGRAQVGEMQFQLICQAYAQGSEAPIWQIAMAEQDQDVVGAALSPGRLYVTSTAGVLIAIGDTATESP